MEVSKEQIEILQFLKKYGFNMLLTYRKDDVQTLVNEGLIMLSGNTYYLTSKGRHLTAQNKTI